MDHLTPYHQQIVNTLKDGPILDPSGMAATTLRERIGYQNSANAFAGILAHMEKMGIIQRDISGRRTYNITLRTQTVMTGDGEVERLRARVAFLEEMVDDLLGRLKAA